MDANDTRTVTSWKKVRDTVPKVWKREKPVRDALIGEAVKANSSLALMPYVCYKALSAASE